jgi:hypothetical protein
MSSEHDADVVRRYVRYLQQRASAGDDMADNAIADHEAQVLWTLARAICGEGLVAHVPLLRRASLDLLEQGGRRLCRHAEPLPAPASSAELHEANALQELGQALLDLKARLELQQ